MFKMEFTFSKLVKIIVFRCLPANKISYSKSFCLDVSEPTKRLAAQSTAYALRNWQGKLAFVKQNEKYEKNENNNNNNNNNNHKEKKKTLSCFIE